MSKPHAKAASRTKKPRTCATGGGNATASGVNFQQSLGAVIGVWMLTETTIDQRLRLGAAKVIGMRMETEAPMDDVLAEIRCSKARAVGSRRLRVLRGGRVMAGRGGKRVNAGRKRARLDLRLIEALAKLHSSDSEISDVLNVSRSTITRAKEDPQFQAVISRDRANARITLRRLQWRLAKHSAAMAIFLGKAYLNQTDAGGDVIEPLDEVRITIKRPQPPSEAAPEEQNFENEAGNGQKAALVLRCLRTKIIDIDSPYGRSLERRLLKPRQCTRYASCRPVCRPVHLRHVRIHHRRVTGNLYPR